MWEGFGGESRESVASAAVTGQGRKRPVWSKQVSWSSDRQRETSRSSLFSRDAQSVRYTLTAVTQPRSEHNCSSRRCFSAFQRPGATSDRWRGHGQLCTLADAYGLRQVPSRTVRNVDKEGAVCCGPDDE